MKKIIYILILCFLLSGCQKYIETEKHEEKPQILQNEENTNVTDEKAEEVKPEEKIEEVKPEEKIEEVKPEQPIIEEPKKEEPKAPVATSIDIDSLPNDGSGWGFVKKKDAFPEFTKGQTDMMQKYGCIYKGNESEKVLYLTFDEGYENGYTGAILDTLKDKNVPAAFFITGPYLEKNQDLIGRMINEGHIVGNHTVHHPNMPSLGTAEKMEEEMLSLDRSFYECFGRHMSYFRPPEGAYSERSLAAANAAGCKTVLWSFAYRDWETDKQQGKQHAYDSVVPYLHNGCVMLLHAVSKDNTEALGEIIDTARSLGYTFKSLDEFSF